jgi:predicted porin
MKKLLLTSALAGATLVASNAIAQTTVSGNLDISFKALSDQTATTGAGLSRQGFGKEAQINVQTKGKLNNGMDYAAGFSLEDDGNASGSAAGTNFNENTFIDFIAGNTTLTIGNDHIQGIDRTLGYAIGLAAHDIDDGITTGAFVGAAGANPSVAFGVGLAQKTPVGTLAAWYTPNNEANGVVGGDATVADSADESAYELSFVGDLGIKGLSTHAFINKENKIGGETRDVKGLNLGASYTFGAVTAGINHKKSERGTQGGVSLSANTTEQMDYGLAYAVSPNLTISANYSKAEMKDNTSGTPVDAKSKSIAVGYNLGAVALTAVAAKQEDYTHVSGVDLDTLYLRASTKF